MGDEKMEIPDYQTIMLPLLKYFDDKKEHHIREATEHIADLYNLSKEEREELLPSGKQTIIYNRVGWAITYMKKAGLLQSTKRGYAKITDRGLKILKQNPEKINDKFLGQFPEFIEFQTIKKEQSKFEEVDKWQKKDVEEMTPDELLEKGHNLINANLSQDLINKLREEHFSVLERVVLQLLVNMGYGEGEVTGQSGDGGVDGFINEDKLGLDKIYFQAKRFNENSPVTSSMLRDFIGALELKGVKKGVFITTSRFPKDASELITKTSKSVILIDGNRLAKLMVDYDIGVTTEKTYKIKRIDTDFFDEE
jgi:restriction system protein